MCVCVCVCVVRRLICSSLVEGQLTTDVSDLSKLAESLRPEKERGGHHRANTTLFEFSSAAVAAFAVKSSAKLTDRVLKNCW